MLNASFLKTAVLAVCLTAFFSLVHPSNVRSEPQFPPKPSSMDRDSMKFLPEGKSADLRSEGRLGGNSTEYLQPNFFQKWEKTVYQSYRDGNWEIYLQDVTDYRLTYTESVDANPDLNSQLTKIAFDSNRAGNKDIYSMDYNGSNVRQLTNFSRNESDPAWSNNGAFIAYVLDWGSAQQIFRMNSDGSGQVPLTNSTTRNYSPTWSPNDQQIAWVSYNAAGGAIWLMNADGTNPYPITAYYPYMGSLSWSPDGSRIAFDADIDSDGWNELAIVNKDGSNLKMHLDNGGDFTEIWMGSWSISGERIAFSRIFYVVYDQQLYLGRTEIQYTSILWVNGYAGLITSGYDLNPDWQNSDPFPPVSRILPLPEFTRRPDFTIDLFAHDVGLSGMPTSENDTSLKIQKRVGGTSTWVETLYGVFWGNIGIQHPMPMTHPLCETIYFRSSVKDDADNWESWPAGDGDAFTRMFDWIIRGKVQDNRETALVYTDIDFSPTALNSTVSDISGAYVGYVCGNNEFSITANKLGYGVRPASEMTVIEDTDLAITLPPLDNGITNPDFEDASALSGWTYSGDHEAAAVPGFNGNFSAMIGKNCSPNLCLSQPEYLPGVSGGNLYVDSNKTIHLLTGVVYRSRSENGTWSDPFTIISGTVSLQESLMIMDPQGTLHVTLRTSGDIYYRSKNSNGTWSEVVKVGRGQQPRMAVDQLGNAYIIFSQTDLQDYKSYVALYKRESTGQWVFVRYVTTSPSDSYDIAIDPQGLLHIITMPGRHVMHATYNVQGELQDNEYVYYNPLNSNVSPLRLEISDQGDFHALIALDHDLHLGYTSKSPGGRWINPLPIPEILYTPSEMQVDGAGTIFFAGVITGSGDVYKVFQKRLGDSVFKTGIGQKPVGSGFSFAVDSIGQMYFMWNQYINQVYTGVFYTSEIASEQEETLSQPITIPVGMHQPTLSFSYKTDYADASLEVVISGSGGDTAFPQPSATNWSHGWIDLSAWTGQTITVNFKMVQQQGVPHRHLYLDEVSLGSWLTPIVSQITPDTLRNWAGATVTVSGMNFIPGAQVKLNDLLITGVVYVDENTIHVSIPENFPLGTYNVWVVNPQDHANVLVNGLLLGYRTYLPSIRR